MNPEEECAEVVRREHQLLDPEVRRHADLIRALLHPEFIEFGASGRIWNVESIIEALTSEKASEKVAATDFKAELLDSDVILLTFKTDSAGVVCLRSSIWVRSGDEKWLLRFHQGTVIANLEYNPIP